MTTNASASPEVAATPRWHRNLALGCAVFFLIAYFIRGGVWGVDDIRPTVGLLAFLWLAPAALIYSFVRRETCDATEAFTITAVASVAMTTGVYFGWTTLSYWFPWLTPYWPALIAICFIAAVIRLVRQRGDEKPSSAVPSARRIRFDWTLLALLAATLCVTARYQRAYENSDGKGPRFVLNGDQTFFAGLAHELERGSPPRQNPMRAGCAPTAYHHLPHLTLALAGMVSGQDELLRLHLVTLYTTLVLLHSLLVFCIARSLGGTQAGYLALWLLFIAAIPCEPSQTEVMPFFYFTLFPHATSTIEPTLLTSPQMFYGLVPAIGSLLCLIVVWRNLREQKSANATAFLAALLVALTMRFRLHCFLVLAPIVLGGLTLLAIRHRKWLVLVSVGVATSVAGLQFFETRLPTYLEGSQRPLFGVNDVVETAGFYQDWPGAQAVHHAIENVLGDTPFARGTWNTVCLAMFCFCNIIGIPMTAAVVAFMVQKWRTAGMKILALLPLVIFVGTVLVSSLIRMEHDRYSVGGQTPFHLGWYLFPCVAVGLWPALEWMQNRAPKLRVAAPVIVWALTFVLVGCQTMRGPSPLERKNFNESLVMTPDTLKTIDFVRDHTPENSVILSNVMHPNYAIWSGMGGRRTYLEYVPAGQVIDPLLPPEDSIQARLDVIDRLHVTSNAKEFQSLLKRTPATHIVEWAGAPMRLHPPNRLKRVFLSSDRKFIVWEIQ